MASAVKVAVRVRPVNKRERKLGFQSCIAMKGTQTVLSNIRDGSEKIFNFDHSFWSSNPEDPHFVDQDVVFNHLGTDVLDNAFAGYNACIFAYGQTGSGKTFTMMGIEENKGIIPRLCDEIFTRIAANDDQHMSFKVEVSYMEIYNEKVQDLLSSQKKGKSKKRSALRVREHKILGPYVEGLSKLAVTGYDAIATLMAEGNLSRTTAATLMNDTSSRSHAVFTLIMTQAQYDPATKQTGEKVSKISLVDLAGSERHSKTGTTGDRLKEGANINKSLTTLGLVISALAEKSAEKSKAGKKKKFVPYRDSVLTWLLKDNLGGNSKTVMVATISPAADNFEETLSTLRYADRAKQIVNHAVVNEDPNARLIRELREELERLRAEVGTGGGDASGASAVEVTALKAKLAETEGFIKEMTTSWEEKLQATETVLKEKQALLDEHSASVSGEGNSLKVESKLPHFISLSDDPLASEITIYTFKEGPTTFGREEAQPDIVLWGLGTEDDHCVVEHVVEHDAEANILMEVVYLDPRAEMCMVNGEKVDGRTRLRQGNVVQLGYTNMFRFNHPTEAMRLRKQLGHVAGSGANNMDIFSPSKALEEMQRQREEALAAQQAAVEAEKERLQAEAARQQASLRERELQIQAEAQAHAQREAAENQRRATMEMEMIAKQEQERKEREARDRENEALRARLAELEAKMVQDAARAQEEAQQRQQLERLAEEQAKVEAERQKRIEELERSAMAEAEKARELARLKEEREREAEEQRIRMEQLLEKQEEERIRHAEEQRLEADRRLQEAESKLQAEMARQAQAQQQLEEAERRLEERAKQERERLQQEHDMITRERSEREAAERMAREQRLKEEETKLLKEKEQQEALRQQLEAAKAALAKDQQKAVELQSKLAETEQKAQQEKNRIEQEKLEAAAQMQAENDRKLREAEEKLKAQQAAVEAERQRREAAEQKALEERQRRELDQASTEKFLAEKAIEEEKKKKMNAQAKEEWMRRLGAQSDQQKLKEKLASDPDFQAELEAERLKKLAREKAEDEERAKEYKRRVEAARQARLDAAKAAERMEELKQLRAKLRANESVEKKPRSSGEVDLHMQKQLSQLSLADGSPERKPRRTSSQSSFVSGPSNPELVPSTSVSKVQPPQGASVAMVPGATPTAAAPSVAQPQKNPGWTAPITSPPTSPVAKTTFQAPKLPVSAPVPVKQSTAPSSATSSIASSPANPFADLSLAAKANPFAKTDPMEANPFAQGPAGQPRAAVTSQSSMSRQSSGTTKSLSRQSSKSSIQDAPFADLVPKTLTRRQSQTGAHEGAAPSKQPMRSMASQKDTSTPLNMPFGAPVLSQPQGSAQPAQAKRTANLPFPAPSGFEVTNPQAGQRQAQPIPPQRQPVPPQRQRPPDGSRAVPRQQPRQAHPQAPGRGQQGRQGATMELPFGDPTSSEHHRARPTKGQQPAVMGAAGFTPPVGGGRRQPKSRAPQVSPGAVEQPGPASLTPAQREDLRRQQMAEAAVKMMQAQEEFVAAKRKSGQGQTQAEKDKGMLGGTMRDIMKNSSKFLKHGKPAP